MTTKHDAYATAYKSGLRDSCLVGRADRYVLAEIDHWATIGRVTGRDTYFGRLDGLIDLARERGLCASVLNWWHKKPAGDELEW